MVSFLSFICYFRGQHDYTVFNIQENKTVRFPIPNQVQTLIKASKLDSHHVCKNASTYDNNINQANADDENENDSNDVRQDASLQNFRGCLTGKRMIRC